MSTELTNSTTPKPKGYKGNLEDGREIYIPNWSATTQWENLTQACKILGQTNVMTISTLNIPAAMLAVMGSDDSKQNYYYTSYSKPVWRMKRSHLHL